MSREKPYIIAIGGSDSSGGAGIQADIISITENNAFATTAITAITSQNNQQVTDIFKLPDYIIEKQIETILNKTNVSAIKTGMLVDKKTVNIISSIIPKNLPIIVDPVIESSSGVSLIDDDGIEEMKKSIFPKAILVTPNINELIKLLNIELSKEDIQKTNKNQNQYLIGLGKQFIDNFSCKNILIKGGHNNSQSVTDILISHKGAIFEFSNPRLSGNFRGTGCRMASAISSYIAQDYSMEEAVRKANKYVYQYILNYQNKI